MPNDLNGAVAVLRARLATLEAANPEIAAELRANPPTADVEAIFAAGIDSVEISDITPEVAQPILTDTTMAAISVGLAKANGDIRTEMQLITTMLLVAALA